MPSPRKRRRTSTAAPPPEATRPPAPTLPSDLLLEIVARSDAVTLVRCAACCKPLRRDILNPVFIRRVCHGGPDGAAVVPPHLFGFLRIPEKVTVAAESRATPPPSACFTLACPATPAAAHLAPFFSRGGEAGGLLALARSYEFLTSRNGLAVLRRRYSAGVSSSSDAGGGKWVWGPVITSAASRRSHGCHLISTDCDANVVVGGSIHWVMNDCTGWDRVHVLTYNVGAKATGFIELPLDRLPTRGYMKLGGYNIR
ncbi:hypothetical protein BS78_05G052500 [Paspalum vaginatum]|nr:hypothetical protein BS78_05G052500 [Paspalum vaginatum]